MNRSSSTVRELCAVSSPVPPLHKATTRFQNLIQLHLHPIAQRAKFLLADMVREVGAICVGRYLAYFILFIFKPVFRPVLELASIS